MAGKTDEEYVDLIHELDTDGRGLSKWEIDFIASLLDGDVIHFSEKQKNVIDNLVQKRL